MNRCYQTQRALLQRLPSRRFIQHCCVCKHRPVTMVTKHPPAGSRPYNTPLLQLHAHPLSPRTMSIINSDVGEVHSEVTNIKDLQSLLDYISSESNHFDNKPELVARTVEHLTELHYQSLMHYQWLQPVHTVARLQIQLMDQEEEVMLPVHTHPGFEVLLDHLQQQCSHLSNLNLIRCLEKCVLLFCDETSPLMHRLLEESMSRLPTFDMECMALFGEGIRHLPKGIFLSRLHPSINRFKELMPETAAGVSVKDLCYFADILRNIHLYISDDLLVKSSCILLDLTRENLEQLKEPQLINSLSYVARRLNGSDIFSEQQNDIRDIPQQVLGHLVDAAEKIIDKYAARHIAEICSSLKLSRFYSSNVSEIFIQRSLQLLSPDIRLADVINLFYSLNSQTSREVKRQFESVIYPKLTEVDSLSLANMAEAFHQMGLENRDILNRFTQLVNSNAAALCQAPSHLYFVVRFLLNRNLVQPNSDKTFYRTLLSWMKHNQSIMAFHTPTIANFCLTNIEGRIPEYLYKEIVRSIPHWLPNGLKRVLMDLTQNKKIHQPQLQMLVTEVQHHIYRRVLERPELIRSVRQLTSFVHTMALHAYYRDQTLTDKLMGLYLNFIHELTPTTLPHVTKVFIILQYYLPEVLDQLVGVVVKDDVYPVSAVVQVLTACSVVGFVPREIDSFTAVIYKKLNQAVMEQKNWVLLEEMRALRRLSMLGIYPEDRLGHLFSLEFIEKVDEYLEANPNKQHEVEQTMMELNRNVILECPQLNVPWFSDTYCRKHVSSEESSYKHQILRDSILQCLPDALGGSQYFRTCVFTPYYHVLDFQCLLDADRRPEEWSTQRDQLDPSLTKVAILPLTELDFCYNSQRLLNKQKVKTRHLEIMGYKVIQIPYFAWYSMGLADHDSKVDFLQQKVFAS